MRLFIVNLHFQNQLKAISVSICWYYSYWELCGEGFFLERFIVLMYVCIHMYVYEYMCAYVCACI